MTNSLKILARDIEVEERLMSDTTVIKGIGDGNSVSTIFVSFYNYQI